ncbi:RidA family protein [Sporomusa acidovorans]|uniref:2-iminobutanoate/2-iminopropanoate deaminase n=1 Tax=Sporomusa acidovorans (strain ATCC 49682 / DSM 3132 / Mol) TaxID=1123286 RepID=A0ABZ3J0G2_SPOA4|nr:RidA family protein [Sporomusa acidovorans]OZC22765.1 2-iminobutanoate/2-iminopropanoate deaminase [Sporomusa acidovorans DSM 3132]SDE50334.1 endoribonuclease L-PSP [Sporomusa acidovorans]
MDQRVVNSEKAPQAIGPYSQGIKAGDFLFISGQLPVNPVSGMLIEGIEAQTRQSIENIAAILTSEGLGLESIIKTTVFLKDINDFESMNAVYGKYFPLKAPARVCVQVAKLPKDALVEIEAVAFCR